MTMIERIARAIHARNWPTYPKDGCTQCEDAARAAVKAMREPTDAMRKAFHIAAPQYDDGPTSGETYWDYAIDAILEEKP